MNNEYQMLRRLDLNLLVVFDALMREQNVSRAAERCFLSQPAMSNALKRLREMLNDQLLVRTANGMTPSPRAKALVGPIRSMLNQLNSQLQPPAPFDPASSTKRFVIALTSYGENALLPPLTARLSEQAPNASLEVVRLTDEFPNDALERGELDLVVGVQAYLKPLKSLRSSPFLKEQLVCVARQSSRKSKRITLKQYLKHRHVYPSPLGVKRNIVESWLEQKGLQRDIAITTYSYWVAARIVSQTDYLLSLPGRIAEQLIDIYPLDILEPPADFPAFELSLIWHPLYENEPAVHWLLNLMRSFGNSMTE